MKEALAPAPITFGDLVKRIAFSAVWDTGVLAGLYKEAEAFWHE